MNKIWNAQNPDHTYCNPILYTDYSDPDAIRVGDDYYMIASSFSNVPGIPVLHSRDMVNWGLINYVLDRLPGERYDKPVHGCGVWAPSIRYHDGFFYVCFPMPDEGIYMCTAEDPYGRWSDPVCIREGAGWIDPCPFWDDDGEAYLVAGVAKSRIGYKSVLHMVRMQPDGMGLTGEEVKIFDGNENDQVTIEGPKLYKRNGWYYIFAPAGGVKGGWQTVLRSRNIFGPYEYRVVMRQGATPVNGPHQGAWIDTPGNDGRDYFLHFQDVYAAGRIVHLQPMEWEKDWPIIGKRVEGEDYGVPVLSGELPVPGGSTSGSDTDFADSIDHADGVSEQHTDSINRTDTSHWQWNANPKDDWIGYPEGASGSDGNGDEIPGSGDFMLYPVYKDTVYGDIPNIRLIKWPAPEFAFDLELDISGLRLGDTAGVIALGTSYGVLTFRKKEGKVEVCAVTGVQHFGKILVDHTEEKSLIIDEIETDISVFIRILVEGSGRREIPNEAGLFNREQISILYGTDRIHMKTGWSGEAMPGRWVGNKLGVFCTNEYISECSDTSLTGQNDVLSGSVSANVSRVTRGFMSVKNPQFHNIYHNPVKRGFFPDPSVVRVGSDYYMVNSSFQYFPAIPISHSTDMIHWELIGHAITDPDYLDLSEIKDSHGIWAPDISYVDGRFVIMATLRLNGKLGDGSGPLRRQLIVTSDKPEGPYSGPVWIEVDNIDPSLFIDDDGKKYMLISPGINLVPLSDDLTHVTGEEIHVWPGTGERCTEGPHLLKKDGYYYAIVAEGGTGYGHGINIGRSRNLLGPYEASPYNPTLRQTDPAAPLQRCGHGKFIQDSDGGWWVYYLCGRPNMGNYTTIGRETALEPVTWTDDGWPLINYGKGASLVNIAPDIISMHPDGTIYRRGYDYPYRDDFDSEVIGLDWEFVRNPVKNDYSLSERPGWMRIYTSKGFLSDLKAENIFVRREEELCYRAETLVDFNPSKAGEQAGLVCYYSTATYARLSLEYDRGRCLRLVINRNHGEEITATVHDIPDGPIRLKAVVDHLTRTFYYSPVTICPAGLESDWICAGTLNNCVYLCDEGVPDDPKRHTGTLVGIYALSGASSGRTPADFDYFEYMNL